MAEIKTERLCHVYSVGTPFEKAAIEGIDLTLPQGQLIGVIGHTGSGKSTLILFQYPIPPFTHPIQLLLL